MIRIVRFALVLVVFGATLAYAFSTGPPSARTGAFAVAARPAESLCSSACHTGQAVNDPSGSLELLDLPSGYIPGQEYTFRLRLSHAWAVLPASPRWGFELQAVLAATGDSAGVWQVVSSDSYRVVTPSMSSVYKSRRYLEHIVGGIHEGQPGPVEWAVHWQAPPADSGLVYFFASANSADGTGGTGGDFIFTEVESLPCAGTLSADRGPAPAFALAAPWPNPSLGPVHLAFTLARPARVALEVYDVNGRRVRTVLEEALGAGPHVALWEGADARGVKAPGGLYFARLRVGTELTPARRIVRLGR